MQFLHWYLYKKIPGPPGPGIVGGGWGHRGGPAPNNAKAIQPEEVCNNNIGYSKILLDTLYVVYAQTAYNYK